MKRQQLTLLEPTTGWRLDEATRERGRRGVAAAREVLRAARRGDLDALDAPGDERPARDAA